MRKVFLILMIAAMVSTLPASEFSAEQMVGGHVFLSIPADHEHVSVNPGFTYSTSNPGYPIIGINIPFAGNYYLNAELGAGSGEYQAGASTLFSLGAGYWDVFPGFEDLFFHLGISYRDINALDHNSSILSAEFLLEQNIQSLYLGVGIGLTIQDYEIQESDLSPYMNDRLTKLILKVQLRSPVGNIELKGMPDAVVAGVSWTLRLDE